MVTPDPRAELGRKILEQARRHQDGWVFPASPNSMLDAAVRVASDEIERLRAERHALWELLKRSVRNTRDVIRNPTPRWDEDPTVAKFGWLDGRCGKCGEELPKAAGVQQSPGDHPTNTEEAHDA